MENNAALIKVLVLSNDHELSSSIENAFGSLQDVTVKSLGFNSDAADEIFDVYVIDWIGSENEARSAVEALSDGSATVLSTWLENETGWDRAIKAGSDGLVMIPGDLKHIERQAALAAIQREMKRKLSLKDAEANRIMHVNNTIMRTILHDLKNPLTVTLGYLQVVLTGSYDIPEKPRGFIQSAIEGCRKQLGLIENISDIIRLEDGRIRLLLEPFDPVEMISEIVEFYIKLDVAKNYNFSKPRTKLKVVGDSNLFYRVVFNMLDHCMHNTKNGGNISLAVKFSVKDKLMTLKISDDGELLLPEFHEAIFDRYRQVQGGSMQSRWDTGMLLSFAKIAMRAMNGDINAVDSGDSGACYVLTLPIQAKNSPSRKNLE